MAHQPLITLNCDSELSDILDEVKVVTNINNNHEKTKSIQSCSKEFWNHQYQNTQLLSAIVKHDTEDVQTCLQYDANPNATCRSLEFTALHLAVLQNEKDIVTELLGAGANPHRRDQNGLTPLHYAAWFNHYDCLNALIENINVVDNRKEYINTIVRDFQLSLSEEEKDGINHGCEDLRAKLPENVEYELTALHIACQKNHIESVKILVKNGADLNLKDNRGFTAFDMVGELLDRTDNETKDSFLEIIKELKHNKAQRGNNNSLHTYFTPIHAAVILESKEAIQLFAKQNFNLNIFDTYGQTPIHLAIIKKLLISLKTLLQYSEKVAMVKNTHGLTPFHTAVKEQWIDGITFLLKAKINVIERADDGRTVLHIAAATGNVELLKELLKLKETKQILNSTNDNGETPLYNAITDGGVRCVNVLLEQDVNISIKLNGNINVIHRAAELGKTEILDSLINAANKKNINLINELDEFFGMTPLHLAARENHLDCVKLLLDRDCDIRKKTASPTHPGLTALHLAADRNNVDVVKTLLNADKKLLNETDNNGKRAIVYAAENGHRNSIQAFLQEGDDLLIKCDQTNDVLDLIYEKVSNPTDFLNSIFNYFVQFDDPGRKITDRDCMIKMDFSILMPTEQDLNQMSILYKIRLSCKGSEQKELLIHPLIEFFLFLKWKKMKKIFLLFFLFYLSFVLFLTAFTLSIFKKKDDEMPDFVLLHPEYFRFGLVLALAIVFTMDYILIISSNFKRLDRERILKYISLISTIILILGVSTNYHPDWLRHIAAVAIISSWIDLMLIISKFSKYGYYIQMFFKVVEKVIKVMLLFSCCIFGFALAFMIEIKHVYAFYNPFRAIMKTVAIMTAELDFNTLFPDPTENNYNDREKAAEYFILIIFFIFILLATISLMNLMIGLAVNDIQDLETKGVVDRLAAQIDFLYILESSTFGKCLPKCVRTKMDNFKKIKPKVPLYLSRPENKLTQEIIPELKESIIEVAENNINPKVDNKEINDKLDKLIKMLEEMNWKT